MSARRVWARLCSDLARPKIALSKPEFKLSPPEAELMRPWRSYESSWRLDAIETKGNGPSNAPMQIKAAALCRVVHIEEHAVNAQKACKQPH